MEKTELRIELLGRTLGDAGALTTVGGAAPRLFAGSESQIAELVKTRGVGIGVANFIIRMRNKGRDSLVRYLRRSCR